MEKNDFDQNSLGGNEFEKNQVNLNQVTFEKNVQKGQFRKGILVGIGVSLLIMILLTVIGISVLFTNISSSSTVTTSNTAEKATSFDLQTIEEKASKIEALIEENYLEDIDYNAIEEGVYAGLVSGLGDRYSVYYTNEEYTQLMESSSGVYSGIGALLSQDEDTGVVTITKVFEGSPAEKAGVLPGDAIYKVGDKEVTGMDLSEAVSYIKGEEGTTVNISIAREGESDYIEFDIVRKSIEVPTVSSEMLDDNIGYIQVTEFDEVTADQFKEALTDLNDQGMEGLIIDLRDNPGGLVDVVCEMADEILPEGLIVYTEDKDGNRSEYTSDASNNLKVPLVVMVNGNSASASEIFSGAVKDYSIGTLVGTTTFGKGIVQQIFDLGDGTAVKLTIEKYFTPKGNNIHGVGIEPDVEVELDEELKTKAVITQEEDNQLQTGIETLKEKIKEK